MGLGIGPASYTQPFLGAHEGANQLVAALADPQARQELLKALTIGHSLPPSFGTQTAGLGSPLTLESLEGTMKVAEFKAEHLTSWRMVPKIPAFSTREQFNRLIRYGSPGIGGFVSEAGVPATIDSIYERAYVDIKYMSVLTEISLVAMLVKGAHGPIAAQEQLNKTMFLLSCMNAALWYGDSDLDALQWDGFDKQISENVPETHIMDKRGEPLGEEDLQDMVLTAGGPESWGRITHMFSGPEIVADLEKVFYPRERIQLPQPDANGLIGLTFNGFKSRRGNVMFAEDMFINPSQGVGLSLLKPGDAVGETGERPPDPTISTQPTAGAVAGDEISQFEDDDAGDYTYWVAAVNDRGMSNAVEASAAETVAAGEKVTLGVTPGGSNSPETKWYILYRTRKDGVSEDAMIIARIPNTEDDGETTIEDFNDSLPGTSSVYGVQWNLDNLSFKQLAPMMGVPFGTQALSARKAIVNFGGPAVYLPKHNFIFRNVGRPVGARGLYTV